MKKLVLLAVLLVFVGSACAADITTGLVGWWQMNEGTGSGGTVHDSSGNGNNGNLGSGDTWLPNGGGIDFCGGTWGQSGIGFNNAELIADLNLTTQATVSFKVQWDALTEQGKIIYDGYNATGRLLQMEAPTLDVHIYNHFGGNTTPLWEAFNDTDDRFIFTANGVNKTWGDWLTVTTVANFDTGDCTLYIDGIAYASGTGMTGSFEGMTNFTIGRTNYGGTAAKISDFRIYNRALAADDVAALVPEPATLALLGLGGLTLIRRKRS